MTKTFFLSMLLMCSVTLFSCSKKDEKPNTVLTETPTAKVQYDASNFGIYKGVFVGSSGTIVIDINNSGTISSTLKIGAKTYNFSTSQTIKENEASILTFTSGTDHFTFTVAASGANPSISDLVISGHVDAILLVVKETSTALVKCFEGTYNGSDAGILNAVIYNNKFTALVKSTTTVGFDAVAEGTVKDNKINAGSVSSGETFNGTLTGNDFVGNWDNSLSGDSGTWKGTRTY